MSDNYTDVPIYIWYLTRGAANWDVQRYFYKGKTYAAYREEPDHGTIDKYNMQFIGVGDYDYIRREARK